MGKKALVFSDDGVIMALEMAKREVVNESTKEYIKSAIRFMRRKALK
jgi:hypothetical protein